MNETLTESDGKNASEDIEAEINQEIKGMQDSREKALFVPVKLEIPCVLFFKTREPVEPVSFVQRVCEEAMNKEARKTTRFVRRLTPATRMGKASYKNLEEIATAILAPVFHTGDAMAQKVGAPTKHSRWLGLLAYPMTDSIFRSVCPRDIDLLTLLTRRVSLPFAQRSATITQCRGMILSSEWLI